MARTAMALEFGPCTHHWELETEEYRISNYEMIPGGIEEGTQFFVEMMAELADTEEGDWRHLEGNSEERLYCWVDAIKNQNGRGRIFATFGDARRALAALLSEQDGDTEENDADQATITQECALCGNGVPADGKGGLCKARSASYVIQSETDLDTGEEATTITTATINEAIRPNCPLCHGSGLVTFHDPDTHRNERGPCYACAPLAHRVWKRDT